MASTDARTRPNILVTGTPGVGKSTTAAALAEAAGMEYLNVGELVKVRTAWPAPSAPALWERVRR